MPEITKKAKIMFIKEKLGSNKTWAQKALLRIYDAQTFDEQNTNKTLTKNYIGFNGLDSKFLSSCAKQLKEKKFLSDKQMHIVYIKMPKYASQLFEADYFDHEKLDSIMSHCG